MKLRALVLTLAIALSAAAQAQNEPTIHSLSWRVVDAEYSVGLERIIMISALPNQLHAFDPLTNSDQSVDLPLTPLAVSVDPVGTGAAVGHDGFVSYVDLNTMTLVDTFPVSTVTGDVVLGDNGFIHVIPAQDQWERIRTIEIATGIETLHTGLSVRAGSRGKLHPDGDSMYLADRGLSPSDIEKYDVSTGAVSYLYDSPYHGDFQMCGDVWISEEGARLFTACGNVFRASPIQSDDMTYNGSLAGSSGISSVSHSLEREQVLVISSTDTEVQVYDYDFLTFDSNVVLPDVPTPNGDFPTHGEYVFHSADGTKVYVIVYADPAAGLLNDYAVVSFGEIPIHIPTCFFTTSQSEYEVGQSIVLDTYGISNDGQAPITAEVKVWTVDPSGQTQRVLSIGDDLSVSVAPGVHAKMGPLDLGGAAGVDPGRYTIGCRVLDAVTGAEYGGHVEFVDFVTPP